MHPVITQIILYPIKSCGGIALPSAAIGQRGLEAGKIGDRRWILADAEGVMITQRQNANLARVRIELAGDALRIGGDGLEPVIADPAEVGGERLSVLLHGREVAGHRAPAAVNAWFSHFLGQTVHLLYQKEEDLRLCDADFAVVPGQDRVGFADAYPYLIATEATLAKVNGLLAEPVPMNRFRPNLVVGGTDEDAEYGWQRLAIGTAELEIVKPCTRCVMTTIDQERGVKTGKEPLATLGRAYFLSAPVGRGTVQGAIFAENAIPTRLGTVSMGDAVTVLGKKTSHAFRAAALMLGLVLASPALAQPEGAPPTAMIPAPEDSAYPGTLTLSVDATDLARHIFTVHESIPVTGPGPTTLLFPKWLPGEHAPTGPISQLAGLVVTANGKRLEWQRDPVE
ncbi:MAG TPA: MOSC N-terminal beta barrel domain-containing protein, partial [Magnetospirillaceae bacterium]|nr:MOSC N-terminal beta barrel domain-containing protein [Magnetospirillaceae bacterium]